MQCHPCILVFRGGPAQGDGPQTHGSTVGGLNDIRTAMDDFCVVDLWDQAGPRLRNKQKNRSTFDSAFTLVKNILVIYSKERKGLALHRPGFKA